MAGERQRASARARLTSRRGKAMDAEPIKQTLERVAAAVERRDALAEGEANQVVSEELRLMRADKRARTFLGSGRC